MKISMAVVAGLVVSVVAAQGVSVSWDGGGGDSSWINDNNWSGNAEPTSNDVVTIGGTAVVDYDRVSSLYITNTYPLYINDTAQLNLTTGALSYPSSTYGGVRIQSGAVLNISGGTHSLPGRISGTTSVNGTIRVTGNDATISMKQVIGFPGTLDFVFDADGISFLDFWSYFYASQTKLTVDASAYQGGSGHFKLVEANKQQELISDANITITPPSPAWSNTVSQTVGGTEIILTLLEPGTILYEDFGTNGLSFGWVTRDGGWRATSPNWSWSSGQLINTNSTAGAGRCDPVSSLGLTTESVLELDLEYSMENGSTPIYIHLWGLKDTGSSSGSGVAQTDALWGMWNQTGANFDAYNMRDGSFINYNTWASSTAALTIPSVEGTGLSYSGIVNIGSFGAGLSRASDYDYFMIGIQKGGAAPDLSIDELKLRARDGEGTLISIR